jgi:exodeoxyribonuclease VII large subunit
MALLDSLSPLAVLNRGYGIVRRLPDGAILRRAQDVLAGDRIAVRLAAGGLQATITDTFKE